MHATLSFVQKTVPNQWCAVPQRKKSKRSTLSCLSSKAHIALGPSRHVSNDLTRSTCRAHAFWPCRACRTARLDTTRSTGSTRRMWRVVSRRDVASQVEFGLKSFLCSFCSGLFFALFGSDFTRFGVYLYCCKHCCRDHPDQLDLA